ncbi:MAG: sigma-54-dependent Fis family transcriptional regulator [Deltaproteobacteria bacterium]|nr:sigma-54-dependent Fis family transcriptional regulator [Candidatus Zymogenaceae bacterium]
MAKVLIIDRDESFAGIVSSKAQERRHAAVHSQSLQDGLKKAFSDTFDVVFLSTRMPDGNWMPALKKLVQTPSSPEVVITTESVDPDEASYAFNNGAWDYIEKSYSHDTVLLHIVRATQYRSKKVLKRPSTSLNPQTVRRIVGQSPQIQSCLDLLAQASNSDAPILINGETGTGKEVFAWAIHNNSRRADKNFVVVDCAALPETLIESTLFGHEKGAFTGADRAQEGLVHQADGGTLFLDEIGELPPAIQKTFLRFLQERSFRSVGGQAEIKSDFRIIAATNNDLKDAVKNGLFREDLYYRLCTFTIDIPPLRERKEDIKDLVMHYMHELNTYNNVEPKGFSSEFFDVLMNYDWPGNVRELFNTIERIIMVAGNDPIIYPMHLPPYIRINVSQSQAADADGTLSHGTFLTNVDQVGALPKFKTFHENTMSAIEQDYFKKLMSLTDGNIKQACQLSGLSRSRLYALLKKHHISHSS